MYNCTIQNIKSSNSQNWLMTSPNTGLSRKLTNAKVDRKRKIPKNYLVPSLFVTSEFLQQVI